jgi:peptidyl-dipeptidase Dcp
VTSANPLLTGSDLPYRLPRFAQIASAHYEEAFLAGMAEQRNEIDVIATNPSEPTFTNTIIAMERSDALLRRTGAVFELITSADTNPDLEAIEERISPLLAAHQDAIYLDRRLYDRVRTLYDARDTLALDPQESWLLERYHTDFVRAGANLSDSDAQRLRALNTELATLCTDFSNRARASINAATLDIADVADLDGLSPDEIAAARTTADGRDATYALGFTSSTAQPVLASLTNRAIRERIFRASIGRGTSGGPNDSRDLVEKIVTKRAERAELMGYPHHAAYQIADNTARTLDAVTDMLGKLVPAAVANARQEAADLQAVIDGDGEDFTLEPWDWAFYSERVRRERYGIDEAEVRPYLELERVLHDGVFYAATKLYGITFAERTELRGYHDDVRVFEVTDADGSKLGLFLADFYTRPTKSGGAWMSSLETHNDIDGTLPVVTNNLNVTKPPVGQPTLLRLDEVRTMFHEFGHALHGLFGQARWPKFAGTSSPRDFIEFPSQVNEVWMLYPEVLAHYARHIETDEPLPQSIVDKLIASESFNEGYATTEYLAASLLDLAWHSLTPGTSPGDVLDFEADALEKAGVAVAEVPPRYRTGYFSHVFSGIAYSAGYYSYIWSEVLDADTVEWFRENGGLSRANGDRYRYELLGKCGSADPLVVYRVFRGRDPEVGPLLKRRRLVPQ